jgi:hypothetical protein
LVSFSKLFPMKADNHSRDVSCIALVLRSGARLFQLGAAPFTPRKRPAITPTLDVAWRVLKGRPHDHP